MRSTTLGAMFRETALRFPERVCVETGALTLSYAQVDRLTDRAALALLELGLGKGQPSLTSGALSRCPLRVMGPLRPQVQR